MSIPARKKKSYAAHTLFSCLIGQGFQQGNRVVKRVWLFNIMVMRKTAKGSPVSSQKSTVCMLVFSGFSVSLFVLLPYLDHLLC